VEAYTSAHQCHSPLCLLLLRGGLIAGRTRRMRKMLLQEDGRLQTLAPSPVTLSMRVSSRLGTCGRRASDERYAINVTSLFILKSNWLVVPFRHGRNGGLYSVPHISPIIRPRLNTNSSASSSLPTYIHAPRSISSDTTTHLGLSRHHALSTCRPRPLKRFKPGSRQSMMRNRPSLQPRRRP